MLSALRAEFRKLLSTRTWWLLMLSMMLFIAFLTAMIPRSLQATEDVVELTGAVYSTGAAFGYAFPLALGVLLVTSEYRYSTIVPTMLGNPSRFQFVFAKLLVSLLFGIVFGVGGTLSSIGVGGAVLHWQQKSTLLLSATTFRVAVASILLLSLWCAVGVGLGASLTN